MNERAENTKEYPNMNGTDFVAFDDYEARLKRWLWTYGNKSNYTAEVDQNLANIFRPALIVANMDRFRDDQMTLFQCLNHAFNAKHSEILRQAEQSVVANVNNVVSFGSTAFAAIRALYRTQNFASAQREIQKLQDLYNTFDGIPKPYFEKINAQVYLVSEHGPAYVQPIVNIVNGVYSGVMMFGMREDATPP